MSTAVQHTHNRAPVLRQRRRARGNGPRSSHGSLRALNEQDEKNVVHARTVPKEGKKFPTSPKLPLALLEKGYVFEWTLGGPKLVCFADWNVPLG